jgi:branched-chain amino acid transport system permease protein
VTTRRTRIGSASVLLILLLAFAVRSDGPRPWAGAAGALLALAVLTKVLAGPFVVPFVGLVAAIAALIACVAVYWLLNRTYAGKGIRAFVQDPEMAAACGVNYRRLSTLVAAVAGATVGATGTIIAMVFVLTPTGSELWIAVIFAVVLLGGLANPIGVAGAALLIGLVESFTRQFADPAMARMMALVVLIIALIFKPEGLFKPAVEEARE